MWQSRTKYDLMIEVWEKLDCESIGRSEIEAIEIVLEDQLGPSAVDPPMVIARALADEGAELRHAEIMELHVERASDRPYDAALRNILDLDTLESASRSIRQMDNLRRKYLAEGDKDGVRLVLETARRGKQYALDRAASATDNAAIDREIAEWLTVWLQNSDVFDTWLDLRRRSADFRARFGDRE